jgi:hypothetical protein
MKTNFKRWAFEVFLEVNNVTNRKNVLDKFYDDSMQQDVFIYQWGLMPIGGLKFYF